MLVQPYLFFDGRCDEAIEFYQAKLGAKVEMLMRFKESPEPPPPGCLPEGSENKVMHACFRIGDTAVMASDGMARGEPSFKGFSLSITAANEARSGSAVRGARRRRSGADAAREDVLLAEVRDGRRQVRRVVDGHRRGAAGVTAMRFMMLMIPKGYEKAAPGTVPDAKAVAAMMKYNESLQKAGVLLSLDGLHPPSMGARVSFPGGKPKVTDGPFIETKEVLGGYWMIEVKSKAEAVEWAVALPRFGERGDRGPPGAGDVGLSARRPEGGGRIRRDAGAGGPAEGIVIQQR